MVRGACRRIYTVKDDFIKNFQECLTQLVPELRDAAPDHGEALAEVLARAMLWAGLTTDPPSVIEETFHRLGAEYGRRGFPQSGYQGATHALLRAARDSQISEWTTEFSSAWVAYFSWLTAHLAHGGERDRRRAWPTPPEPSAEPSGPTGPLDVPRPSGPTGPLDVPRPAPLPESSNPVSLDQVLLLLRSRYFAADDVGLEAIVARLLLRTGIDLFAPRPDQSADPVVIANVISILKIMGYVLHPAVWNETVTADSPTFDRPPRDRWWKRRRAQPSHG
jgi:hypothetical protein